MNGGQAPLFIVFGAFGAGKTSLAPIVAAELRECLVLDVDWLLPWLSLLAGRDLRQDEQSWPALGAVWLAIAAASAHSARSTVLFTPTTPAEVEALPGREMVGEIHGLLLDCDETELRRRFGQRIDWDEASTQESLEDAARYRALGFRTVRTDRCSTDEAAAEIAASVRAFQRD